MEHKDLKALNLPDVPGVYLFKQGRKVLYVGKATSLRDRVRSYFDDDLIATRGPRVVDMVTKASRIVLETTPTVLEALVREATLIKKHMPHANVDGKDDKTFLYAVITKEDIPRVLVVRGKDIDFKNRILRSDLRIRAIYGPFPSGTQLREGLRLVRRIFPFFDTPKPVGTKSKHQEAKIEFNMQIKQYPRNMRVTLVSPTVAKRGNKNASSDSCSPNERMYRIREDIGQNKVNLKKYRKSIRKVEMFLSGRGKELRRLLEREMKVAAREERFEDAAEARRKLFALDHIQDVSLIRTEPDILINNRPDADKNMRIEAYDTAHLSGTNAIGVMTVVVDGTPIKKEYRTFRIRGMESKSRTSDVRLKNVGRGTPNIQNDDIASLKEILSRRLGHPEWQLPQAIVVDGGTTHKKAAESVLAAAGVSISVVAVVKDERHRPREVIGARSAGVSEADAVFANSEAHRFSLARHRRARSRKLQK